MKQLSFESSGAILQNTEFVVIDCETTGISPIESAITEIAAVSICGGEITGSLHSLINPEQELTERIIRLTSITNEELVNCPTIDKVLPSLVEFIGNKIIIGHNIKFDIAFINSALSRYSYPILSNDYIDTLTISRKLYADEVINFKLSTLAKYINATNRPTHRAYSDVLATIDLFHSLVERSSSLGVKGVNDFIKIPSKKNRKRYSKRILAKDIPPLPGIYIFISNDDEILYVGKSRNMKERLRSYFISDDRSRIGKLISSTQRIEYITTPSAYEARILELRTLQEFRPEYNKTDIDQNKFTYLSLDLNEYIPALRLSKYSKKNSGSLIYGPFTTRSLAIDFKEALTIVFNLRHCDEIISKEMNRPIVPCINSLAGIHSCFCSGDYFGKEKYLDQIHKLSCDLPINFNKYTNGLIEKMKIYSGDLQFERAKKYFEYSIILQKWMIRFSNIEKASNYNSVNLGNIYDIENGRAIVKLLDRSRSTIIDQLVSNNNKINNEILSLPKDTDRKNFGFKFLSNPVEFRERLVVAN